MSLDLRGFAMGCVSGGLIIAGIMSIPQSNSPTSFMLIWSGFWFAIYGYQSLTRKS